ncbi:glycosyltransferase family 2 protein [Flavobacterium sp.]|uniref:glycosyltransferase family 2 protein n=1 Tax=Flavobacterium sp. TaxID=239 RepID=UPI002488301B|nr:glycosyltransferase family 2 protein [Flavobacterium sp.]MDI1316515.1 glycosyltransferase family 2 protein [Flavobacterium sp.]
MPFFSIVIPVYNKEKFVEKTLKGVLNQTFTDFEIIIVNDGSTDQSETIIFGFEDERINYFSKPNEGVSTARNFGIEKSCADYICFLDADDYWYPSFLETLQTYIQKLPEEKVFGLAYEIETDEKTFPAQYSIQKTNDFEIVNYFEASKKDSILWTSSAAFHKDVFKIAGNFNINLKNFEDIHLWIRIGLRFPIVFVWKIQAKYSYDSFGLSRSEKINLDVDFSEFALTEANNPELKHFLDLNRFSLAIKSKLINDTKKFLQYYNGIDLTKLPLRKRILLNLPGFVLKILVSVKLKLTNIGLGNSVFR